MQEDNLNRDLSYPCREKQINKLLCLPHDQSVARRVPSREDRCVPAQVHVHDDGGALSAFSGQRARGD